MSLNPPGFKLYDGVSELTAVLQLAAISNGVAAHIQTAQDAERADLIVVNIVGPHHECQTPDRKMVELRVSDWKNYS